MSEAGGSERHKTVAVVVAYLALLDDMWPDLDERERRAGVRLALEAAHRAAIDTRPAPSR